MTRKMGSNPADGSTRRARHAACVLVAFLVMGQALAQEERGCSSGSHAVCRQTRAGLTAMAFGPFPDATTITGGCPARSSRQARGPTTSPSLRGLRAPSSRSRWNHLGPPAMGAGLRQRETSLPTAEASGSATICPGLATRLMGSGGASCEWTPAEGLDDPHSCAPIARPSSTTTYHLVVACSLGCESTNDAAVTVNVAPDPQRVLTVDRCLPPDTPGLLASVSGDGGSYSWEVSGGTITSGQSTPAVTFTSGPAGTPMKVAVEIIGRQLHRLHRRTNAGRLRRRALRRRLLWRHLHDRPTRNHGRLRRRQITAADSAVRRDQMAVVPPQSEARRGWYRPPPCMPPGPFLDVACPGPFTDWVEQLAAEEITRGCGEDRLLPGAVPLRRDADGRLSPEGRARARRTFLPLAPASSSTSRAPVHSRRLDRGISRAKRITGGCRRCLANYCPDFPASRAGKWRSSSSRRSISTDEVFKSRAPVAIKEITCESLGLALGLAAFDPGGRGHLHRHEHQRFGSRLAAPGDPRRQRHAPATT